MDRQCRPDGCELFERLALRHWRGAGRSAGQDYRLGNFREGQLAAERRCSSGKGRHTGGHVIRDAECRQAPHLLGDRTVERGVAGMKARDIEPGHVRPADMGDDLVQGLWCGVVQPRAGRGRGEDLGRLL